MKKSELALLANRTLASISFGIINLEDYDLLDLNISNVEILAFAIYTYHAFHTHQPELAREVCDDLALWVANSHGEHNSKERMAALQKITPILGEGVANVYENNQTTSVPPHIALGFDICDAIGNGYNERKCNVIKLGLIVKQILDIGEKKFKEHLPSGK